MNDIDNTQSMELKNLSAENSSLNTESREMATLLAKRELELAECKYRLKVMTSMYEEICSSLSWTSTAPIRRILDKVNKSVGKTRKNAMSGKRSAGSDAGLPDDAGLNRPKINKRCPGQSSGRLTNVSGSPAPMLEILYVYKIASFGGVERVLLNRAEVFKRHDVACRLSLYFYDDEDALEQIHDYVVQHDLASHLRIVSKINAASYDYVISIDTPEILNSDIPLRKIFFECHTTYYNSQRYLAKLPDRIRLIAVPSEAARLDIAERFPRLVDRLLVVRNFIPLHDTQIATEAKVWEKRPLLYLGRLDEHKNFTEVLDIFQHYLESFGDDLFLLLVGPVVGKIDLTAELSRRNISDRTVVMPPVSFDRVWQVYSQVKQHQGCFISSSMAESFGLAAAEALTAGVPVLLSGIASHRHLVADSLAYVYPLGDAAAGARKLRGVVENYDRAVSDAEGFGRQFSEEKFLSDWQSFMELLQR